MGKVKKIISLLFTFFMFTVNQNFTFAAELGDQLLAPEEGWSRYEETHPSIKYSGNWNFLKDSLASGGSIYYTDDLNATVTFKFTGSKVRIIGARWNNRSTKIKITIDGVAETYSAYGTDNVRQTILYEKALTKGEHEVQIKTESGRMDIDSIDIDSDGEFSNKLLESVLYNKLDNSASISAITDGNYQSSYTLNSGNSITYTLSKNTLLKEYEILTGTSTGLNLDLLLKDKNGKIVKTISDISGEKYLNDSTLIGVKYVTIQSKGTGSVNINELALYGEEDETVPADVTSVTVTHSDNTVTLYWKNPTDKDFKHVNLFKDSVYVDSTSAERYDFTDLLPSTAYNFKITTEDLAGNESSGVNTTVKTNDAPKPEEIKNIHAQAEYNRVDLSWELPTTPLFHHVNIYRKQLANQSFFGKMLSGTSVSAAETSDGFKPMFETNGTYWNDLTVSPETTYEYKLTTESTTGNESTGQIVKVTTLEEPAPEMGGEEVNTDVNGDYKVSWTSPTEGKVKILVDGNEYAVVDASTGQYVIPAANMKYDLFGKPKVKLVAVSTSGKEGEATKPPVNGESPVSIGVTMPFTVNEFLKTVLSLIGWIGPFILLALAIRFAPRIIAFLKGVIAKYREGKVRL